MRKTRQTLFALAVTMFFCYGIPGAQEYAWLHVDGKYIRRSSQCTQPNAIWQGCGIMIGESTRFYQANVDYVSSKPGINNVRLAVVTHPQSWYEDKTYIPMTSAVANFADPYIQALKLNRIYTSVHTHSSGLANAAGMQEWKDDWTYLTNHYKNDPWVMSYEITNETMCGNWWDPNDPTYPVFRSNIKTMVNTIRNAGDTRHIIVIPSGCMNIPPSLRPSWETNLPMSERFNPDPVYKQVTFSIHCYANSNSWYGSYAGMVANDELGRIQDTYNVSLMVTEFAAFYFDETAEAKKKFVIDLMECASGERNFWADYPGDKIAGYPRGTPKTKGVPWQWLMVGGNMNLKTMDKIADGPWKTAPQITGAAEIWGWAANKSGSRPPVAAGQSLAPAKIICSVNPSGIPATGTDLAVIRAIISDKEGYQIWDNAAPVTFSISGGTWEDGTTANKTVNAVFGLATIKVKSTALGTITVTANSGSLTAGTAAVAVFGAPFKVVLSADPSSIAADGQSTSFITAEIQDAAGKVCENILTGIFNFSLDNNQLGSLWLNNETKGSSRVVQEAGKTYILLKSGTTKGTLTVTGSYGSLQSGSVKIYLGQAAPATSNPFPNLRVYPNPLNTRGTSSRLTIEGINSGTTMKLYTLSGRLVNALDSDGSGITWDLTNLKNKQVRRGLYVYVLQDSSGNKKTGKIVIK